MLITVVGVGVKVKLFFSFFHLSSRADNLQARLDYSTLDNGMVSIDLIKRLE